MVIRLSDRGRKVDEIEVDPGGCLWRAMEVWLKDMPETWDED